MNNVHLGGVSRRLAPKTRAEEVAERSTPRSPSRCCPPRSSPGRCLRCSAGRSPGDCNPCGTQRSSPGSDRRQLYLAGGKYDHITINDDCLRFPKTQMESHGHSGVKRVDENRKFTKQIGFTIQLLFGNILLRNHESLKGATQHWCSRYLPKQPVEPDFSKLHWTWIKKQAQRSSLLNICCIKLCAVPWFTCMLTCMLQYTCF